MKYYSMFELPAFSGKDLSKASAILRNMIPAPKIKSTQYPDREYSFNEIASNIRTTLLDISKSLY
jgi:hypothetical protein